MGWGTRNGYSLYRCGQCTHRFADVGPGILRQDPEEFRRSLTHNLMQSDSDYYSHLCIGERDGGPTRETARIIIQRLQMLQTQASRDWLDIGSGSGYLVSELCRLGWNAMGIEPGGWGQIAAQEKGITVIQGFLDERTFDRRFACISATDVLEHQSDPVSFMKLVKFYLASDGLAFVSVPYADSFHGKVMRHRWSMVEPPTHCQFFTQRSFRLLLKNLGLGFVGVIQFNMSYPPLLRRTRAGRTISDWLLDVTMGGDQAVFVVRKLAPCP